MHDAATLPSLWERTHMFGALFWVLLAIFACFVVLRFLKRHIHLGHPGIRILGSSQVGTREHLHIVLAGDVYLLIGVTPNNISLLHCFGKERPEGFADTPKKKDFSAIMAAYIGNKKHEH